MSPLQSAVSALLYFFLALLIFRLVMEYVFLFARSWRPSGFLVVLLELTYSITDPPLKALRRVIPPLRLGNFALDLSFFVLFVVVSILLSAVVPVLP